MGSKEYPGRSHRLPIFYPPLSPQICLTLRGIFQPACWQYRVRLQISKMIRELSDSAFHGTFALPMRKLGADEMFRPVPLGEYVTACIDHYNLPTSRENIDIDHVCVAGDERHTHVMLNWGVANLYLVVVVSHETGSVLGHHILDLNEKYGLTSTLQPAEQDADGTPPLAALFSMLRITTTSTPRIAPTTKPCMQSPNWTSGCVLRRARRQRMFSAGCPSIRGKASFRFRRDAGRAILSFRARWLPTLPLETSSMI